MIKLGIFHSVLPEFNIKNKLKLKLKLLCITLQLPVFVFSLSKFKYNNNFLYECTFYVFTIIKLDNFHSYLTELYIKKAEIQIQIIIYNTLIVSLCIFHNIFTKINVEFVS